ncbi:MAG: NAD(P)-dependent oxidoreductase [Bacilli bacterium]
MKIVILDDFFVDYDIEYLSQFGTVKSYPRLEKEYQGNDEELINRIGNSEIVVTCHVKLNKQVISKCSNLKYIVVAAVGVNHIDIDYANKMGIKVSNIPNYGSKSVAQASVALLLQVVNRVSLYHSYVKNDKWINSKDYCIINNDLIELDGKIAGIIGYGMIGKACGEMLRGFGMELITYDIDDDETVLNHLLATSDVISMHCPLTKENKYMINKDRINKMKDGVIIINTSRGSLINSDDLYDGLKSGKIYFAGCDVVDQEPIGSSHKLLSLPNFILTPHMAWGTREARKRVAELVALNIEHFIKDKPINLIK